MMRNHRLLALASASLVVEHIVHRSRACVLPGQTFHITLTMVEAWLILDGHAPGAIRPGVAHLSSMKDIQHPIPKPLAGSPESTFIQSIDYSWSHHTLQSAITLGHSQDSNRFVGSWNSSVNGLELIMSTREFSPKPDVQFARVCQRRSKPSQ